MTQFSFNRQKKEKKKKKRELGLLDEFGEQSTVKEMLFIKSTKTCVFCFFLFLFFRSFGAGLHSNFQASRELWTNGVL